MKFKVVIQRFSGSEVINCKNLNDAIRIQEDVWNNQKGILATGMRRDEPKLTLDKRKRKKEVAV
jgi:hypothetical protein